MESGYVSAKSEVHVMMKNVVDVIIGSLSYWVFGFGMSLGIAKPNNSIIGTNGYLLDPSLDDELLGPVLSVFLFQFSISRSATSIISGAMAER